MKRVAIASDHAGYGLKKSIIKHLHERRVPVEDLGTRDRRPVDYPDYAEALANTLLSSRAERGILICGSGVGAAIAANRIPGIRAGLCHDTFSAHQGVEHDDMNVLVLGAWVVSDQLAYELTDAFLRARFSNEDRHVRRLAKVSDLSRKFCNQKYQWRNKDGRKAS